MKKKIEQALLLARECTYADEMTDGAKEHLRGKLQEAIDLLSPNIELITKEYLNELENQ